MHEEAARAIFPYIHATDILYMLNDNIKSIINWFIQLINGYIFLSLKNVVVRTLEMNSRL